MRFQISRAFESDWRRLSMGERSAFAAIVRNEFHPACERRRVDPTAPWPAKLRVRSIEGAAGIREMIWSVSGPDGRATCEWIEIEGEPVIRWRRISGHSIFRDP